LVSEEELIVIGSIEDEKVVIPKEEVQDGCKE